MQSGHAGGRFFSLIFLFQGLHPLALTINIRLLPRDALLRRETWGEKFADSC